MIDLAELDSLEVAGEIVDPIYEQREAWLRLRSGKLTCSKFGDIIGTGQKKGSLFTGTGITYLNRLVAERLGSWYSISASALDWGTSNEAEAIAAYAANTQQCVDATPFNFFELTPDIGGTPDGLIGTDGCIEVKCPFDPSVHVNTMIERVVPSNYEWQVYGHMLVTGRQWCDFVSYDPRIEEPRLRIAVVRVDRSETKIAFLRQRLDLAAQWVTDAAKAIQERH